MIKVKAYRIRVGKEKFRPGQTITELDPAEEQRLIEEGYAERVPSSDFEQVPEKQEMIYTSYPEEQVPGEIREEPEDTGGGEAEGNQLGEIKNGDMQPEPPSPAGNDEPKDEQDAASEDTEQTEETDESGPVTSYPAEPPEPEKKSAGTSRHRRSGDKK